MKNGFTAASLAAASVTISLSANRKSRRNYRRGATLQSEVLKIRGINDLFNSAIATKYLLLLRI